MHRERNERTPTPPLPPRLTTNQAMSTTLRLWGESESRDRAGIQGAVISNTQTAAEQPTAQREVDGVIARWRAAHPVEVWRAC
ncbi:hypothetical protein [Nocardia grenadensis]|uniref:hypothetical protein n=1 Tax=Nocardia grenadensis TaxID=931537 RepID=UPI003D721ACD